MLSKTGMNIQIDDIHSRAICAEIGDRFRDIEAGHSAGCRTILIGDGYGETFKAQPDAKFDTLTEAADWILKQPVKAED